MGVKSTMAHGVLDYISHAEDVIYTIFDTFNEQDPNLQAAHECLMRAQENVHHYLSSQEDYSPKVS